MKSLRIKDVARINQNTLPESTDPSFRFRYIDIGAVDSSGNVAVPDHDSIFSSAPSRARRKAFPGSVLVSTVRTYLRAIAAVPEHESPLIFSTGFAVLDAEPGVSGRFLGYHCRSQPFVDEVVARSTGVSYPAINASEIGNLPVSLPSLKEQHRIADFLDAETSRIDTLTSMRRHQSRLLIARSASQLSALRQNLCDAHGTVRLRHLLTKIEQGWSPQCEDRLTRTGEWGVVKAGCVNSGTFDPLQHKTLPSDIEPRLEYALEEGDLLMSRASGSQDLIGSVGIITCAPSNLLLCDKVYRLTVDRTLTKPDFVAYMLRSHSVREHIKLGVSGGEGMANNLPVAVVKDCVLPNMPLSTQAEVVRSLDQGVEVTARARAALKESISLLAERRQALITAAVTGQFDVSTASGRNVTDGV
ncbi:restriction endonuclease subunit S [Streptomyces parvus]|uniref:restriction endonuclease subunit S n=1 Tax=Streptomyces parvus TaxID=66428 RepID=UPI003447241E